MKRLYISLTGDKKYFWHSQEVFTELLAEFNIRIKVYEKEAFLSISIFAFKN